MATKKAVPSRAEEFFKTGATLAAKIGIVNVTRRAIAEKHNVSDPLVGKHVGGKAELQAGIKKTMKKLGLSEPAGATIERKGAELRARKATGTAAAKPRAKKLIAAKKATAAKKSAPKKAARPAAGGTKPASTTKRVASPAKPADPKKGAPSRKVVKKAPTNKRFQTKTPPLPELPALPKL
jgi:hypothetical protein